MSLLRHTPQHHDALQHVAELKVVQQGWEPHHFMWATGGAMFAAELDALADLLHARLITISREGVPSLPHRVLLTLDGSDRLAKWNHCDHKERVA